MFDSQRLSSVSLSVIAVIAVGAVMRLTGGLIVPLVFAVLFFFVFAPVVDFFGRLKIPRLIATVIVLLLFLAFGFLVGLILYSSIQSLLRDFPRYQVRLNELLNELILRFDLPAGLIRELDINRRVSSFLFSISGGFMSFVNALVIVIIYLFFMLLEKPYMRNKVRAALKDHTTRKITIVFAHITQQIGRYVSVKLFVSGMTAVIIFVGFSLIGVDFPFIWGILTFMFNFIPSIGSIIITVLSVTFTIIQFLPDWSPVIAAAVLMASSQLIIGNIIDPKLLGDSLNLSPVVILVMLLFWGWLWGVIGMFLAVPLTVALKITFENIPGYEPVGILMGTGNFRKKNRRKGRLNRRPRRTPTEKNTGRT